MRGNWWTAPARFSHLVLGTLRNRLGLEAPLATDDRRILETVIFPYILEAKELHRVLFVGCDYYTSHYTRLFDAKEYWTIDKDPSRARYGARLHAALSLARLGERFPPSYFDVIVVNGVVGWGLDEPSEIRESFEAASEGLRMGGLLVVGYNDSPDRLSVPLSMIQGSLEAFVFEPLRTARYETTNPNRHTFAFFRKRLG